MAAIKFELKNILTKNCLPGGDSPAERGRAVPFTAYFCRDDQSLWISDAEGNLISISDLLSGAGAPRTFPCFPVVGPQGPQGLKGATGATGPQGAALVGPQGPKGDRGDVLIPNESELAAAVIALRQKVVRMQAALFSEMDRLPDLHPSVRVHIKNVLERIKQEMIP